MALMKKVITTEGIHNLAINLATNPAIRNPVINQATNQVTSLAINSLPIQLHKKGKI